VNAEPEHVIEIGSELELSSAHLLDYIDLGLKALLVIAAFAIYARL
jgi:hypothetical protein